MLPTCIISGILLVVTRIGKGSISLAHTGLIPESFAARGKPPEPSNKLPNVNIIIFNYPFLSMLFYPVKFNRVNLTG